MTTPDLTGSTWRKSSYSSGNGGNCVEIAFTTWATSSHSGSNGGQCVEIAFESWTKSSRSGSNGGSCVEIGRAERTSYVGIRDTKDRTGGHLTVPATAWTAFLHTLR